MRNQSVFDKLAKGFGDAVADIREKVVEEPWYGRVLDEPMTAWPQAREAQPEAGEQERDMDMDR